MFALVWVFFTSPGNPLILFTFFPIVNTNIFWACARFFLAKRSLLRILFIGCARRGASGALNPQSAIAGLNSCLRSMFLLLHNTASGR